MAWTDILAFAATLGFIGAAVYGVLFVIRQINQGVTSTKEALKERGLHISDHGVKVKTSKRFDREDYVDATQRGIIKAMGAASYGQNGSKAGVLEKFQNPNGASKLTKKSKGSNE